MLAASFHHPVQAINKSAQIREAFKQGNTTLPDIQAWLISKGIQASERLIQQQLDKLTNKVQGSRRIYNQFARSDHAVFVGLNTGSIPATVQERLLCEYAAGALNLAAHIYGQVEADFLIGNATKQQRDDYRQVVLDAFDLAIKTEYDPCCKDFMIDAKMDWIAVNP